MKRSFAEASGSKTVRIVQQGKTTPDLPPDQVLQAKILCTRHNSALSSIDAVGGRVFHACREGQKNKPAYSCRSIPGVDLERWILKVMCGATATSKEDVPTEWLRILFGYDELSPPAGLCMFAPLQRSVTSNLGIEYGAYRGAAGTSGGDIAFDGIRFTLDLGGNGRARRASDVDAHRAYRPNAVWFDRDEKSVLCLAIEWGDRPADGTSIALASSSLSAGP